MEQFAPSVKLLRAKKDWTLWWWIYLLLTNTSYNSASKILEYLIKMTSSGFSPDIWATRQLGELVTSEIVVRWLKLNVSYQIKNGKSSKRTRHTVYVSVVSPYALVPLLFRGFGTQYSTNYQLAARFWPVSTVASKQTGIGAFKLIFIDNCQ